MFTLAFIGMYAEREGGVLKEGDNLLAMFGRVLGEVNVNNYTHLNSETLPRPKLLWT